MIGWLIHVGLFLVGVEIGACCAVCRRGGAIDQQLRAVHAEQERDLAVAARDRAWALLRRDVAPPDPTQVPG